MSRTAVPIAPEITTIGITHWPDPVVEAVGHDLRSPYVERFWTPLLGPSTTLFARQLAAILEASPDGAELDVELSARSLGLSTKGGASSPFLRAIGRTVQFHIARPAGPAALMVRSRVQTLSHRQLLRLPEALQEEHRRWEAETGAGARHDPTAEDDGRVRARKLAASLIELGESAESAESQLHRWRFHPAVAHDAVRWATSGPSRPAA